MTQNPKSFFFASETADGCLVLKDQGQYSIRVTKSGFVCINNYNYPLITTDGAYLTNANFRKASEELEKKITNFRHNLKLNLFTSESGLRKNIYHMINEYRKRFDIKEE